MRFINPNLTVKFQRDTKMEFLLATTITCAHLNIILIRLYRNLDLTPIQKMEVAKELKAYIKICPIEIKKD